MSLSRTDVEEACGHVSDVKDVSPDCSAFQERIRAAYRKLVEVAENGTTITYRELGDCLGIRKRGDLRTILDGITYVEYVNGRPPLSVVVVKGSNQKPDVSFFDTVDRLGLREEYYVRTDAELIAMMASNVYAEWQPADV